jgi:hypothetical protein
MSLCACPCTIVQRLPDTHTQPFCRPATLRRSPMWPQPRFVDTALHCAARCGDLEAARALVAADPALVRAINFTKETPLIAAAKWGRWDVARWLLVSAGADANARDNSQFGIDTTALREAVLQRAWTEIEWLCSHGATMFGACWSFVGHAPVAAAQRLVGAIRPSRKDLGDCFGTAVYNNNFDLAQWLFEAGRLAGDSPSCELALCEASSSGNVAALRWLLARGGNMDTARRVVASGARRTAFDVAQQRLQRCSDPALAEVLRAWRQAHPAGAIDDGWLSYLWSCSIV